MPKVRKFDFQDDVLDDEEINQEVERRLKEAEEKEAKSTDEEDASD